MTLPWLPLLRSAGLDPRVRGVSDAARGVWFLLLCAADDHGHITGSSAQSHEDIAEAVAGIGAGVHLTELRGAALVLADVGAQRLHLPDVVAWRAECTPGAAAGKAATVAPRPTDEPLQPADVLRASAARLRALWAKHHIESAEARAAWIDAPAGLAFLEREALRGVAVTRAWALTQTLVSGDNRGRFGTRPATAATTTAPGSNHGGNPATVAAADGSNHGGNPGSPPAPLSPKETRKEAESDARTAATNGSNHGGNPATVAAADGSNHSTPRCGTVEHLDGVDRASAGDVFVHLRGEGKLRLSVGTAQELELARALAEVSPAWTREGVQRLARHIGAGHLRDGWKPSLTHLRGRDGTWTTLLSLHDEAQGCARCTGTEARAAAPPPEAPPSAPAPMTREQLAANAKRLIEAQRAARAATPRPPTTPETPDAR